jgi:hypothetical protein
MLSKGADNASSLRCGHALQVVAVRCSRLGKAVWHGHCTLDGFLVLVPCRGFWGLAPS